MKNKNINRVEKLIKLVDFLQDNTDLAEMISAYGGSDEATENNPEGDYAQIERWLAEQMGDDLETLDEIVIA